MKKGLSPTEIRNVLLVRTDRIGDVVLTTPVITLIKENYPDSHIFFLTTEYTAPLLKHHRFLEDILIYQPQGKHRSLFGSIILANELKQKKIDVAFLFYPTPALSFSLRLAKIPIRVGTGYRWYSFFFNHRIFQHRKHGLKHELEYNLFLLKDFVKKIPSPDKVEFSFIINKYLKEKQRNILQKMKISKSYVIIHPGSGGSAPNLPPYKFAQIADYIMASDKYELILVGSKSEHPLLKSIAAQVRDKHKLHIVSGDWNIEAYAAIIAGCCFFISNSTGPLHIARALMVPLLAFYCPALPYTPKRWGPYNQINSVLSPQIDFPLKCSRKRCPFNNCLDKIEWYTIKNKIDERLKSGHGKEP